MYSPNCCFLTYIQISQEAGQVVWYSHLFKNYPLFVVISTVKGFGVVKKAKEDVFLELSCLFDDPVNVGNLIFGSSAFSKSSLNIWKFIVHVLLKPALENFEHYFASVWDECSCVVVEYSFLAMGLEKFTFHSNPKEKESKLWTILPDLPVFLPPPLLQNIRHFSRIVSFDCLSFLL